MAAARVTGVQNIRFCATSTVIHRQPLNVHSGGTGRVLPTVTVTQRNAEDRHHLEVDLRFSAAWTGLLEARGSLAGVLVEAASRGGTGTSCWNWRAVRVDADGSAASG